MSKETVELKFDKEDINRVLYKTVETCLCKPEFDDRINRIIENMYSTDLRADLKSMIAKYAKQILLDTKKELIKKKLEEMIKEVHIEKVIDNINVAMPNNLELEMFGDDYDE